MGKGKKSRHTVVKTDATRTFKRTGANGSRKGVLGSRCASPRCHQCYLPLRPGGAPQVARQYKRGSSTSRTERPKRGRFGTLRPEVRRRRPAASGLASGAGVRRRPAASGDVRRRPAQVLSRRPAASGARPAASGGVRRRPGNFNLRPAASGARPAPVRRPSGGTSTCVRRRPAASGARLGLVRPRPGPVRGTSGPRPDRRVRRTPGATFRTGPYLDLDGARGAEVDVEPASSSS